MTSTVLTGARDRGRGRPTRRRALRCGDAILGIVASATPAGCAVGGTTPRGSGTPGAVAPPAQLRQGATISWAVDTTPATRKALRDDQVQLFRQQFPEIKVDYLEGATASKARDETWELMKLLASKESVRQEAVRGEAPPSRRSVANEPAFSSPSEAPGADMKVVVEALEALHLETALLQGIEIDRVLGEDLAPMWRGERTVREVVAQAAGRIRPLLNPPG